MHLFPRSWRLATVICLPRAEIPPQFPASYRLVSLLSSLNKVIAKTVLKRLEKFTENNDLLPDNQQGFRRRQGYGHQLRRVAEDIDDNMNWRRHKAVIWHLVGLRPSMTRRLNWKINPIPLPLLLRRSNAWPLISRQSWLVFSRTRSITTGVPQGLILSPLPFNLFCSDIPSHPRNMTSL